MSHIVTGRAVYNQGRNLQLLLASHRNSQDKPPLLPTRPRFKTPPKEVWKALSQLEKGRASIMFQLMLRPRIRTIINKLIVNPHLEERVAFGFASACMKSLTLLGIAHVKKQQRLAARISSSQKQPIDGSAIKGRFESGPGTRCN